MAQTNRKTLISNKTNRQGNFIKHTPITVTITNRGSLFLLQTKGFENFSDKRALPVILDVDLYIASEKTRSRGKLVRKGQVNGKIFFYTIDEKGKTAGYNYRENSRFLECANNTSRVFLIGDFAYQLIHHGNRKASPEKRISPAKFIIVNFSLPEQGRVSVGIFSPEIKPAMKIFPTTLCFG